MYLIMYMRFVRCWSCRTIGKWHAWFGIKCVTCGHRYNEELDIYLEDYEISIFEERMKNLNKEES